MLTNVTSWASLGRNKAFSAMMTLPPMLSGTNISNTERSKHTEVENNVPATIAGVKTVCAHRMKVAALRCSRATPFGLPEDPEVNNT